MPKTLADTSTTLNPSLLAMTPRQVLLANPKMTSAKPSALNKEDKALVLLSIARYLQKNGFSKTLKKFKSEAQLEEDGWKDLKLDLEEICLKFLDKGSDAATCSSGLDQDVKKKKSKKKNCENMVTDESGAAEKSDNENRNVKKTKDKKNSIALTKESQEPRSEVSKEPGNDAARESQHNEADKKQKDKKKKDCRSVPESVTKEENPQIATMPKQATRGKSEDLKSSKGKNDASSEVEKKSKDKKKRKSKFASNEVANDVEEKQDLEKLKSLMMDIRKAGSEGETINSEINKEIIPQKRKILDSEENASQPVDKEPLKQSKRRKKQNKGTIASEQNSEVKASKNGEVDLLESQKTPSKHQDGKENWSMDKTAEKSETGKDTKKKGNGSAEPQSTAAKAFQRVKVDEVVFADERLQDNSYWAKDGAEIGYGAKAQEVLGQVRGKDFRHEKTKKKRGSYRGGQIDLQAHSVKFNYSDDE